jgi:hypothetical protein
MRVGRRLTRDAVQRRMTTTATVAARACPSLKSKHVHPHTGAGPDSRPPSGRQAAKIGRGPVPAPAPPSRSSSLPATEPHNGLRRV